MSSKQWYGAIGAGIGAVIGSMLWQSVILDYGWVGSGVGALIGVYTGYWIFDRK